jgi:hypothetical protein
MSSLVTSTSYADIVSCGDSTAAVAVGTSKRQRTGLQSPLRSQKTTLSSMRRVVVAKQECVRTGLKGTEEPAPPEFDASGMDIGEVASRARECFQ